MGYKEELLKKFNELKEYKRIREQSIEDALQVDRLVKMYENLAQVEGFLNYFNNARYATQNFGSLEKYQEFKAKNQALFQGDRIPSPHTGDHANPSIPNVNLEEVLSAIEESTILNEAQLEDLYKQFDPKLRAYDLPMTDLVNSIKADADALFDKEEATHLKEMLDYANGEMVQKLGKNFIDDAIENNSKIPLHKAVTSFREFVQSKGLDPNVVVNHNGGFLYIAPEFIHPENIDHFKPFLHMESTIDPEYQEKIKGLNDIINGQDLVQEANGGETGFKEYGLMDYFNKQRALKYALTQHAKLQTDEEKRESLKRIDILAKETQDVTKRYEKVLNYIKENFDLDNVTLPGNVYGGRPNTVGEGGIDNWYPNLPPRYDFENAKAVVFLNGFTQLKAACQWGDVSIDEYLADPNKAYLKSVENIGRKEDANYYLPRGEENPLGKRMARVLVHRSDAYNTLKGYGLVGGRGLEFLINANPDKESQVANTITSNVIKEYEILYNHNPDTMFGNPFKPDVDSIKNLFAMGDQEDELYKLSNVYRDKDANLVPGSRNYDQALLDKRNVPIDQEYRNLMKTLKDFATERKYINEHQEKFGISNEPGHSNDLTSHSLGVVISAGREYFEEYMLANNLSVASIEDDELREEVTSFLIDPVGTLTTKYVPEEDLSTEGLAEAKSNCRATYIGRHGDEAQDFIRKFNDHNVKPGGYNVGKNFRDCLDDNKGSWWERWRGTTSKQYQVLQKIGREAIREGSNIPGDNKALYSAAKAYKEYKMPEGTRFEQLSTTAKRRIEFCDSIIEAYEAQKREAAAEAEANQPQVDNNIIQPDNNIQADFQNQLSQDLEPKNIIHNSLDAQAENANEKDPPDEGVQP